MMKMSGKLISFLIGILLIFAACDLQAERVVYPDPRDVKKEIAAGEKAANDLVTELSSTLKNSIEASGYINTITICNQWAPLYAERITKSNKSVREIKRTAFRVRNPQNEPDQYEKEALLFFSDKIAEGEEPPPYYYHRIIRQNEVIDRYYQPLYLKGLCLNCHGDATRVGPEVMNKIKSLYPDDKATGYQNEELRGVISVTVQLPETE